MPGLVLQADVVDDVGPGRQPDDEDQPDGDDAGGTEPAGQDEADTERRDQDEGWVTL